jgi:hypothetical protein
MTNDEAEWFALCDRRFGAQNKTTASSFLSSVSFLLEFLFVRVVCAALLPLQGHANFELVLGSFPHHPQALGSFQAPSFFQQAQSQQQMDMYSLPGESFSSRMPLLRAVPFPDLRETGDLSSGHVDGQDEGDDAAAERRLDEHDPFGHADNHMLMHTGAPGHGHARTSNSMFDRNLNHFEDPSSYFGHQLYAGSSLHLDRPHSPPWQLEEPKNLLSSQYGASAPIFQENSNGKFTDADLPNHATLLTAAPHTEQFGALSPEEFSVGMKWQSRNTLVSVVSVFTRLWVDFRTHLHRFLWLPSCYFVGFVDNFAVTRSLNDSTADKLSCVLLIWFSPAKNPLIVLDISSMRYALNLFLLNLFCAEF